MSTSQRAERRPGRSAAEARREGRRGTRIEGAIAGEFEIDAPTGLVLRWRAYGEGRAWGQTDTAPPEGKYPVVWAMVETRDATAQVVPPIWYGISPVWKEQYLRAGAAQ